MRYVARRAEIKTTWPIRNAWTNVVLAAIAAGVIFVVQVLVAASGPIVRTGNHPWVRDVLTAILSAAGTVAEQWRLAISAVIAEYGVLLVAIWLSWKAVASLESRVDRIAEQLEILTEGIEHVTSQLATFEQHLLRNGSSEDVHDLGGI